MSTWKLGLYSSFLALGFGLSYYLIPPPQPRVLAEISHSVTNSATVGILSLEKPEGPEQFLRYSLFGYTSSYATVRLEGLKLSEKTTARPDGYFEFVNFLASDRNLEFCLTSIDTENLVSPPLCIPVPVYAPGEKYGPYLLPPSLRLTKGDLKTGETTTLSGKTIPKVDLKVYVFNEKEKTFAWNIIKSAQAANNQPEAISLRASDDGSYTSQIYSKDAGKKRLFTQAVYQNNRTPKSVTLTVNILSILLAFLTLLWSLLRGLFNLNTIIALQILALVYLLRQRRLLFNWYYLAHKRQRAIVVYRPRTIEKAIENYCPLDK